MGIKNIIVLRFSSMGDVAMTVPVLTSILEKNPTLKITVFSRKEYAAMFTYTDRLDFIGIDFNKEYKGLPGLYKISKMIRKLKPIVVLDLHNVLRTKIIRFLLPDFSQSAIKKGRKERKALTAYPNKILKPLKPVAKRYSEVFEGLNLNLDFPTQLKNHLPYVQSSTKKGIGIAPFAAFGGKIYAIDKTQWIANELAKKGFLVYLFGGGKEEQKILSSWEEENLGISNLSGKFSLAEELQKIAELEVMLCMDSANMHLASLVGTRVLSIWGATHPFAGFLGFGQSYQDCIQRNDLDCRPCSIYGEKKCLVCDKKCLDIPKEEVLARILEVLEKK